MSDEATIHTDNSRVNIALLEENERLKKSLGNAAKMREALSDACYAMFNFLKTQKGGYEEMANTLDKAKTALAEPPRNCDRFADELDAQIAFLNEVWLISVTKETMLERDKFENWTDEMRAGYARWLMATVKEEDSDGSE